MRDQIRIIVTALLATICLGAGLVCLWRVYGVITPEMLTVIVRDHFRAMFLMPLDLMTAFVIVVAFRASSGPIEFEALRFKFKGASGETVMWMACVFVLAVVTHLLW